MEWRRFFTMMNALKVFSLVAVMVLLTGCGSENEIGGDDFYGVSYVSDLNVKTSSADRILLNISSGRLLSLRPASRGIDYAGLYRIRNSAYCKRKCAAELALYLYDYKLLNYGGNGLSGNFLLAMRLDAFSNFQYNLISLCHIPRKIIISPRVSYSFFDWIGNMTGILIDTFLAFIMLFAGPFIGFICHPLESMANLTVGLLYIPESGIEEYWVYLKNVNLIASVWDMIKGICFVLLRAVCFWFF